MSKPVNPNIIWVSAGVTKNMGDFNSFRIDAGVSAEVDDVNDEENWKKLWTLIDDQLDEQMKDVGIKQNDP